MANIRTRYGAGASVEALAKQYGRRVDTIRRVALGHSYQSKSAPSPVERCARCSESDIVADNSARRAAAPVLARCGGCEREVDATVAALDALGCRIRCDHCVGVTA
ncbi:hypothetical protein FG87_22030 [Nocardia vulneris]|uniref:Uncharacterized protein n=1 Tax=Nocardia vulneris TaxID=1141657 RepID=A0ABR4ZCK3_9NOCA|nr:hypothetical protein FG87_22030 [Nocardia vulneris]